jgi:hypothetical protein
MIFFTTLLRYLRSLRAVLMVAPKDKTRDHGLLDCIELSHQFGEECRARFVEQRPPGFLTIFGMHD